MCKDLYNKPEKGKRRQQIRSQLMLLEDELIRLANEKLSVLKDIVELEEELGSIDHV